MPKKDQKIIILLASFNGAGHLAEQLESFARQSHQNWELVVSDDGSTDRTIDIVRRFAGTVHDNPRGTKTGTLEEFPLPFA